ncbi:T9SS type A sorting domain-containing protein [Candidatus Latescibacterota bacterium]
MRKVIIVFALFMAVSSFVFAATFAPTPMRLSGDEVISYAFDGSPLDISVSLTGAPGLLKFFVSTKGKADEVLAVRNGYLGWHYMDKIDTCVYLSGDYQFSTGTNHVLWDGKDNDGGIVPPGEYTYYLWAFDSQSPRIKANPNSMDPQTWSEIIEFGEDGQPLANPFQYEHDWRWTLGNDPDDENLTETGSVPPGEGWRWCYSGAWTVDPTDHSIVYPHIFNANTTTAALTKYNWVPNDTAVKDDNFDVTFSIPSSYLNQENDGTYVYLPECNYKETVVRNYFHIVDITVDGGEYLGYIDHSELWESVDDYENYAGLMNNGMSQSSYMNGLVVGGCHCCCLRAGIEPLKFFDDEEDTVRWENGNGDYIMDDWSSATSEKPWVCCSLGSDHSNHGFALDTNGILEASSFFGVISFDALTPDGSGIGSFSYAGEVDQYKAGNLIVDTNSAFDGCYTQITGELSGSFNAGGVWYIARDSFKGIISEGAVDVENNAPAAFSVGQNSPNPFNPTTTISFSLAEAGNITVDVFNVAGQKINTLVDGFTDAGSHSVVWDASELSAGVYFCSVKSGAFTKTIKMTLLK